MSGVSALALFVARVWCAVAGHHLDANSANSESYQLHHCVRCDRDVYSRWSL